jgi:hypothetical protein
MPENDLKQLAKAVKNKDINKLKSNPIFILQFLFSFIILLFCIVSLLLRRFKDNETILWSIMMGILGTYTPTSHLNDSKQATSQTQSTNPIPTLTMRDKKNNDDNSALQTSSVDYYSV